MATEQQIVDPVLENHQLSTHLLELENLLQQTDKLRKLNFLAVSISLFLMLIILSLFIIGLVHFFQQYPKRMLMQDIFIQSRKVLYPGFSNMGGQTMDSRILAMIQKEFRTTIKKQLPQLRMAFRQSAKSLKIYMDTQLKDDFRSQMYKKLMLESKAYLSAKNLSADEQLMAKLSVMNSELASEITENVFEQLKTSRNAGKSFRQELQNLRDSQEYRHLCLLPRKMVEDRLIENILEYCICSINENKGMEPALPGGFYE